MSADFEAQHFGEPEEAGTPGVERYRKARAALAAAARVHPTMVKGSDPEKTMFALAAALRAFMPTYTVRDLVSGKILGDNLETREEAQQLIAEKDPAARHNLAIIAKRKSL